MIYGEENRMDTLVLNMSGNVTAENVPALDKDFQKEIENEKPENIVIDMSQLVSISSSGLRLIIKLSEQFPALSLVNVNDLVYDILETTGFTKMFDVKRAYKEISLKGLPVLGEGATATVYRIDNEKVVKIYKEGISEEELLSEQKETRNAFITGVPTMIAFESVRAGNQLGTVYEAINSEPLISIYSGASPEKRRELIVKYAAAVKKMCRIKVKPEEFPRLRTERLRQFQAVKEKLAPDTRDALEHMLKAIPNDTTFSHGDCHMGNFMIDPEGRFIVIDLGISGCGNPIFSLNAVCLYRMLTELLPEDSYREKTLLSFREGVELFHQFIAAYFHGADEKDTENIEKAVYLYCCLLSAINYVGTPLVSDEMFRVLTDRVKEALDEGFDPSVVFKALKDPKND